MRRLSLVEVIALVVVAGFFALHIMRSFGGSGASSLIAALTVLVVLGGIATFVYEGYLGSRAASPAPTFTEPRLAHALFNDTRAAGLWFVVRLYVGAQWLEAGYHKLTDPAWMQGGVALKGFWQRVVQVPANGQPPITYGWYRSFIQYMLDQGWYSWFAKLVAVGEFLVGIALILGLLTGIAAAIGAFMNFNFMLAGVASTNPVLFVLEIGLILAWKVAGWWGVDHYLLPLLGVPWQPGQLFRHEPQTPPAPAPGTGNA